LLGALSPCPDDVHIRMRGVVHPAPRDNRADAPWRLAERVVDALLRHRRSAPRLLAARLSVDAGELYGRVTGHLTCGTLRRSEVGRRRGESGVRPPLTLPLLACSTVRTPLCACLRESWPAPCTSFASLSLVLPLFPQGAINRLGNRTSEGVMSTRAGMPASRSAWPRTSGIQQLPRTCEQSSKPAVSSCGRCAHERPVCHQEDAGYVAL
jgi:hypothetical protein